MSEYREYDEIVQVGWQCGASVKWIAERIGVEHSVVKRVAKRLGLVFGGKRYSQKLPQRSREQVRRAVYKLDLKREAEYAKSPKCLGCLRDVPHGREFCGQCEQRYANEQRNAESRSAEMQATIRCTGIDEAGCEGDACAVCGGSGVIDAREPTQVAPGPGRVAVYAARYAAGLGVFNDRDTARRFVVINRYGGHGPQYIETEDEEC